MESRGQVSKSTRDFWSFIGKLRQQIMLNNSSKWGLNGEVNASCSVKPKSPESLSNQTDFWKTLSGPFAVATELKALANTQSEVGARARSRVRGVNNAFQNQFGVSGLPENWIMLDELYGAIFIYFFGILVFCRTKLRYIPLWHYPPGVRQNNRSDKIYLCILRSCCTVHKIFRNVRIASCFNFYLQARQYVNF